MQVLDTLIWRSSEFFSAWLGICSATQRTCVHVNSAVRVSTLLFSLVTSRRERFEFHLRGQKGRCTELISHMCLAVAHLDYFAHFAHIKDCASLRAFSRGSSTTTLFLYFKGFHVFCPWSGWGWLIEESSGQSTRLPTTLINMQRAFVRMDHNCRRWNVGD